MKLTRELELSEAKLAHLRKARDEINGEIAALEETREAQALQMLKAAGIARLPFAMLGELVRACQENVSLKPNTTEEFEGDRETW